MTKYVITKTLLNPIEPLNIPNNHPYNNLETARQAAFNIIHHDREIVTTHPKPDDPVYEIIEKPYVYIITATTDDQHREPCEVVTINKIN